MEFVDTHCHIHESHISDNPKDATQKKWIAAGSPAPATLVEKAAEAGVTRLICVGCTFEDSMRAVQFAQTWPNVWASIGIHPHEATRHLQNPGLLTRFAQLAAEHKVAAVGECGLDYFYNHSPKKDQETILRFQLELAQKHDLPMIFHVREAFNDFWPIFDEYDIKGGVIHSFTATKKELDEILARGLYVGLNGIMTFTKNAGQLTAAKAVPRNRLLLETDAPFLTPAPQRDTICEPKHVRVTAKFLAELRGETLADIAAATTRNAQLLFDL